MFALRPLSTVIVRVLLDVVPADVQEVPFVERSMEYPLGVPEDGASQLSVIPEADDDWVTLRGALGPVYVPPCDGGAVTKTEATTMTNKSVSRDIRFSLI